MITIKYKTVFTIEFLHEYYASGKCNDLALVPTQECQELLRRLGLRFLPTTFGGAVLGKVKPAGSNELLQNPLPDNTKLSFAIRLRNRLFDNFTNINSQRPRGTCFYFNNLVDNALPGGLSSLVTNTTTKIVTDADLVTLASGSFSFTHAQTAPVLTGAIQFIDRTDRFEQTLANYNNTFNFSYDLRSMPAGRAAFFIEGALQRQAYVLPASERQHLFGMIDIFYRPDLPASNEFIAADHTVQTRSYTISFGSLATKWRYVITRKFNTSVSAVTVAKTNGTAISFTAVAGTEPGQFVATSGSVVPLRQEPLNGIRLSDQANNVLIANLPNPNLHLVRTQGADIISDILVTI